MLLAQGRSEEILRTRLAQYDCNVELGIALQDFQQEENYVEARVLKRDGDKEISQTIRCRWLIGADGAKGEPTPLLALT